MAALVTAREGLSVAAFVADNDKNDLLVCTSLDDGRLHKPDRQQPANARHAAGEGKGSRICRVRRRPLLSELECRNGNGLVNLLGRIEAGLPKRGEGISHTHGAPRLGLAK